MTETSKTPNEIEIVDAYNSGKLINDIFDRFELAEEIDFNSILSMCIGLHNAQKINLLSLTERPEFAAVGATKFFSGQHFFCKVIPRLKASTAEMMNCVRALVEKGGEDLAANQPNAAFREWCEADLARAHEVVDSTKEDDPLAQTFLTFALTAGNMAEEAKGFIEKYTDGRRLSGIAALGRMKYADPTLAREALSTLLHALEKTHDDVLFANILMAALDIVNNNTQLGCDDAIGIIRLVRMAPGPQTHFSCARALWIHGLHPVPKTPS